MFTAICLIFFYFLPTLIARLGRRGSVFVINLFLGWTMRGGAMINATTRKRGV